LEKFKIRSLTVVHSMSLSMCKYCTCIYFYLETAGISKNMGFHNNSVMMNAYSPTLLITACDALGTWVENMVTELFASLK